MKLTAREQYNKERIKNLSFINRTILSFKPILFKTGKTGQYTDTTTYFKMLGDDCFIIKQEERENRDGNRVMELEILGLRIATLPPNHPIYRHLLQAWKDRRE